MTEAKPAVRPPSAVLGIPEPPLIRFRFNLGQDQADKEKAFIHLSLIHHAGHGHKSHFLLLPVVKCLCDAAEVPASEGMATGTHEPPRPEAGAESNVFAR